jgi:hypothetical protein
MGDAILIEIRPQYKIITRILTQAVHSLPQNWITHYWHGEMNNYKVDYVHNTFLNTTFPYEYALGKRSYKKKNWWEARKWFNMILTNKKFWDSFVQSHLLLFQIDTAFCPTPTRSLDFFYNYTFVGAPWNSKQSQCRGVQNCVGNCGLALFHRKTIRNVLKYYHKQHVHRNFDIWLMNFMQHKNLAPARVAIQFSVETSYDRSVVPFGVHNPFPHLNYSDLHHLSQRCQTMHTLHNSFSSNWGKK